MSRIARSALASAVVLTATVTLLAAGCSSSQQAGDGGNPDSSTSPQTASRWAVRVIDVIPRALSAESEQDSEPNLAVDPEDPQRIAASAFTPNPLGNGNAPIFVSTDGGDTWRLNPIVVSQRMTGDISVRFGRAGGALYAGILQRPGSLRLSIQSSDDFTGAGAMTEMVTRDDVDQPYLDTLTVDGGDRVYVGNNDLGSTPRTATLDQRPDGVAFTTARIEARTTSAQNWPPVRPAAAPDGVVYATFFGRRGAADFELVVVRDDDGGAGAAPFQDLRGSDGMPGVRVVRGIDVPFENSSHADFGQERLAGSSLSIAVDPSDSNRVCVAWGDRRGSVPLTLHLRCSADAGTTWSASDLRTVSSATNPALAVDDDGTLGFLYQRYDADRDRWITEIEMRPGGASAEVLVLATVPADRPTARFLPYIGDYLHLSAVGTTFYGIFSANNTPDRDHFPQGVTFQRQVDFGGHRLRDLSGRRVDVSIDPFFFVLQREDEEPGG
jgi:hypothetical protein